MCECACRNVTICWRVEKKKLISFYVFIRLRPSASHLNTYKCHPIGLFLSYFTHSKAYTLGGRRWVNWLKRLAKSFYSTSWECFERTNISLWTNTDTSWNHTVSSAPISQTMDFYFSFIASCIEYVIQYAVLTFDDYVIHENGSSHSICDSLKSNIRGKLWFQFNNCSQWWFLLLIDEMKLENILRDKGSWTS